MVFIKKVFFVFILIFTFFSQVFAQNPYLDSLQTALKTVNDTTKVNIFNTFCREYQRNDVKKALEFAEKGLKLSQEIEFNNGIATSLINYGNIHWYQGNYGMSIDYYLQALKIYEKIGDIFGTCIIYNNLGSVYKQNKELDKALKYYFDAHKIGKNLSNYSLKGTILENIASVYARLEDYDKAMEYYDQSVKMFQKTDDPYGIVAAWEGLGETYHKKNNPTKALEIYFSALDLSQRTNNDYYSSVIYASVANIFLEQNKVDSSLKYYSKSFELAKKNNNKLHWKNASEGLAKVYEQKGDIATSYQYYKMYNSLKDSMFNEDNSKRIASLQSTYEITKKQDEILLLTQTQRYQHYILAIFFIALLIVGVFAYGLFKSNKEKKKINNFLTEMNLEVNKQKEEIMVQRDNLEQASFLLTKQNNEIEKKQQSLTDSINYAKRIQTAILPISERISQILPEYFILFRPKAIVSGDFYWIYEKQGKIIIAAIDCTGHGVPGAFMSLIGDSLLNKLVIDSGIIEPQQILYQIHKEIKKVLNQDKTGNKDGMDIALATIDAQKQEIAFSGARRPFIYIQNAKIKVIKGDKLPIGGEERGIERIFTKHIIPIDPKNPLHFYLFSDGYEDQFGGEQNRKFMSRRLQNLLFEVHDEPMEIQKLKIEQEFEAWKGNYSQIDDVLLIGVKV